MLPAMIVGLIILLAIGRLVMKRSFPATAAVLHFASHVGKSTLSSNDVTSALILFISLVLTLLHSASNKVYLFSVVFIQKLSEVWCVLFVHPVSPPLHRSD